jgi:hypothetical protein
MVKRNTKKVSKPLSLGGLRKGLEHMKMCALKMSVPEFQKEYKKVFGKTISIKEAKLYMDSMKVKKGQSGGAAPLHYELQGGSPSPYGSYPAYVSGGFGFANQASTLGQAGGVTTFPSPDAKMGSNLVGGAKKGRRATKRKMKNQKATRLQDGGGLMDSTLSNVSQLFSRPFVAMSPATIGNDIQMLNHGASGFPSPHAEIPGHNITTPSFINNMNIHPASRIV